MRNFDHIREVFVENAKQFQSKEGTMVFGGVSDLRDSGENVRVIFSIQSENVINELIIMPEKNCTLLGRVLA